MSIISRTFKGREYLVKWKQTTDKKKQKRKTNNTADNSNNNRQVKMKVKQSHYVVDIKSESYYTAYDT